MKKQFHNEEVIKREQARMQKRACRPHLYGKKITVPTRNGSMHAFIYNKENLHPGYLIVEVHGGGTIPQPMMTTSATLFTRLLEFP